jgi:hypothetical protein
MTTTAIKWSSFRVPNPDALNSIYQIQADRGRGCFSVLEHSQGRTLSFHSLSDLPDDPDFASLRYLLEAYDLSSEFVGMGESQGFKVYRFAKLLEFFAVCAEAKLDPLFVWDAALSGEEKES